MAKDDPFYIERRDDGKYNVDRANAERASHTADTQKQAIDWAKDHTDGAVHVERVRNTDKGGRDQWRKP